jgi:pyruvate formate lyase activating enzyme
MKGLVSDIQRFSIQDGPGIRTTVFVKGCPLRCGWCSNPESQNLHPDIFIDTQRCNKCGKCQEVCSRGAITLVRGLKIDKKRCDLCLRCVEICSPGAITLAGKCMDVDEVVREIKRDKLFYKNSGGGITLSGGEPLFQPEFTYLLLKSCQENGLHTAIDTCGYAPWAVFDKVLVCTNLLLFDIKHMDS